MSSEFFRPSNFWCSGYRFFATMIVVAFWMIRAGAADKPNIILIQADDLGWDDIALNGNKFVETPAIDQLGKDGIQFNHFYLNSVCAPTRASLLTGRHFLRTGVSHVHGGKDFINLHEKLLPESLKLNGYRTGMWGKWHSGKTAGYYPWERGFDEAYMAQLYKHENSAGLLNGKQVLHRKWASEVITDYAIDFINERDERPFFAYLSFLTVHAPLKAPAHLVRKYTDRGLSNNLATLYGMIDQLDSCINVLLSEVEKQGISENTIIIFMSDNGPAYNGSLLTENDRHIRNHSNLKGHKGNLWENGVKSPLLVKWPRKISSAIDDRLVGITDIYPTLVELGGGKYPDDQLPLDGESFASYFEGGDVQKEKFIYDYVDLGWADHTRPYSPIGIPGEYDPKAKGPQGYPLNKQLISVRNSTFKLMQNPFPVEGANFERYDYILIDTDADPLEDRNVKELHPEVFKDLREKLSSWFLAIMQDEHALQSPEFKIDEDESMILGYGPATITRGLANTSFYLEGWDNDMQSATYSINIEKDGKYVLEVEFGEIAAPILMKATIGNTSAERLIEESGESQIGVFTLTKNHEMLTLQNEIRGASTKGVASRLVSLKLKHIK